LPLHSDGMASDRCNVVADLEGDRSSTACVVGELSRLQQISL
jgi:hypothetical protein